ncbi:glycosyltransferase family protein [Serinicoccus chungangensis]|uniref:glycosyltransferase family protein n=1 Tax=Serinicoccus chungangensis TaxID=767452 RepID=UPI001F19127C|nr:glycosyltransferase [Serinicoccus chungangensis]
MHVPDGPVARPDITAAVILDPFSELALQYEWRQVLLSPVDWRQQIVDEKPDLIFLESAWKGNRGAWRLAMTGQKGVSQALVDLLEFAKSIGIPTVLWNKEDPPNYDRFIKTARLVDFVFTVDAQKIPDYRRDLGHDRVEVLPFAAQPRIHNPVESGDGRSHGVAFAGSYFNEKHSERRGQMEYILGPARKHGLEIYSRMQNEDERYHFPEKFREHIVGSLPYEEMLAAYTQYKVFLNVNTVTDSPSMCSRRLFELSAAATPVISGPAASVAPFFGADVLVSESEGQTDELLASLVQHEELRARIGLKAHRRVMREHTYGQRVNRVLSVLGIPTKVPDRSVSMVIPTRRPDMMENVISFASSQSLKDKEVVIVLHGFDVNEDNVRGRMREAGLDKVVFVRAKGDVTLGTCMNLGVGASSGRYVAKMDDDNYYGVHYLEDLVNAFHFTDATVVGKWAHYAHLASSGTTLLRFPYAEKRFTKLVQGGTIVTSREDALDIQFEDLPRRVDTTFLEKVAARGGGVYSSDRFNFVSRRSAVTSGHTWTISDSQLLAKKSTLAFFGDPTEHVTV